MNKKNGFWLFVTSCLSGCGQMYQGYMKRGLSLLLAFFVLIGLSGFLHLSYLTVLLPVMWVYAFFDSYNLRSQLETGTAQPDAYLFGLSDMDSQQMNALLRKRHSVVGWVLVALGGYMLWDTAIEQLRFLQGTWMYSFLRWDLPRLAMTVGIIALGLWFIRGPRAKAVPEDDIPVFTPPAESAPEAETEADHGDD